MYGLTFIEKKKVELNKNEAKVFKSICYGDTYDDYPCKHPSDIGVNGLTKNQIKGYISQLLKKDVIFEIELPNNVMCWASCMTYEEVREHGII